MNRSIASLLVGKERSAIEAFLERVRERYPELIHQAILFGSKARGDSRADSDIDVLLVVNEESWPLRQEISTLAAQVSLAYDVLIGPRVIGRERWARMRRYRFTLYENVQADGIELIPEGGNASHGWATG